MSIGFSEVQTILDARFATLTGLPDVQSENTRRKTSVSTSFSRTQLIPTETELMTLGACGQSRLNGLYVIDLFYPRDDGTSTALADVDIAIRSFEAGLFLTDTSDNTVQIVNSWVTGALPNLDKFYQRQVMVQWWAYRTRTV